MRRSIPLLHLRHIRRQPLRSALVVLAVGAGVSLAVAVFVDQASLDASVSGFTRRLAGPAALRVTGPGSHGGLDATVLPAIERVDGVASAVPVVQSVTVAEDGAGRRMLIAALGVDCSIEKVFGPVGCSPAALASVGDDAPPVLSASLARRLGPTGVVRTDVSRLRVRDALTVARLDSFNQGRVAVLPLLVAQRVFAKVGALDAVYVLAKPGVTARALQARVAAAVGPWNQVLPATEAPAQARNTGAFVPTLLMIGLFALAIAAQLVYNTIALSLEERRRELAVTGALGGTPRLILTGSLVEAGALGLAGGLIGVAGGVVMARPLVSSLSYFTEHFAGLRLSVHVPVGVVVGGLLAGVAVAMAAAWVPARRATRLDLSSELHDQARRAETAPRVSYRQGAVLVAVGVAGVAATWMGQRGGALRAWQPPLAELGMLVAAFCFFRAVGRLAPGVIRLVARLRPLRRGPARLGLSNLARQPKRTSVMAVAVGAAVGLACVLGSLLPAIGRGAATITTAAGANRLWVSNLPANNSGNIDAKLSPSVEAALATLPGVAAVDHGTFVAVLGQDVGLLGVNGVEGVHVPWQVFEGRPGTEAFGRGDVMVGPGLARALHLRPGSTLRVPGRTGMADLRVGGVWADPNDLGRGITMRRDQLERIWGPQPVSEIYLRPATGVSPEELAGRVQAAGLDPDLLALTPAGLAESVAGDIKGFLDPFWALQRGLLLVAFIATLSTLLLVGVQRRREQGVLGAIGMGPRQLAAMTLVEAGAIGVAGTVLGAVASVGTYLALSFVSPILTGLRPPFSFDPTAPLAYGVLTTLFVLAGAALPAWRTARLDVVAALQYE